MAKTAHFQLRSHPKKRRISGNMYTMEYYSAIKKNEIMPFATWKDLKIIILTEAESEKDKYRMLSLICGI